MKKMKKGKFIVFEGIDGCGKTTQIDKLVKEIIDNQKYKEYQIFLGKEPTYDSKYGLKLRRLLAESKDPVKDGDLFCKYMILDRQHHCNNAIKPQLNYGSIVICDRYKYSTFAYQQPQGISFEKIKRMHDEKHIITPDIIFILDVPADIAMSRIKENRNKEYKFEREEFLEKVRQYYLKLKENLADENIIILDGTKSIDAISKKVNLEFGKLF